MSDFVWKTESETPAPTQLSPVGDALNADDALRRVRKGEFLLYEGDFHNAKQLLGAMGRRLPAPRAAATPLAAFRAERTARAIEHETLGRIVVELDANYALSKMKRTPDDVAWACKQAWGKASSPRTVVGLKTLLGLLGAAEWRKKGIDVPGLTKKLTPHYGVYLPTRTDYVELLRKLDMKGLHCFDIGTGTGVLGLVMIAKGATTVVGTDVDPRAVLCARENADKFGFADRFKVEERELFPEGRVDLIVCNPPWVPEAPKNRVDRAVFDEDSQMLKAFLTGVHAHLRPRGRAVLILSNLAELLGLREIGALESLFAESKLTVLRHFEAHAKHGKAKDPNDPLHAARSKEVTTLYELVAA